jgi:hypothetical protein
MSALGITMVHPYLNDDARNARAVHVADFNNSRGVR